MKLFLLISIALSLVCACCELYAHYVLGNPTSLHGGDRAWTWPVQQWAHWRDFRCWIPRFRLIHTMGFFSTDPKLDQLFMYPAPAALLFVAFYSIPRPLLSFLILTTVAMAVILVMFFRTLRRYGLGAASAAAFLGLSLLFSYPMWFEFDLGNMEIWMWFFVLTGIWAFLTEKPYVAATFFTIAAACKIFPFIFFSLFLSKKRYAPIVYGAVLLFVLNLAGLWVVFPNLSIAMRGVSAGLAQFHDLYFLPNHFETGFDHSLFALLKVTTDLVLNNFHRWPSPSHHTAVILKESKLYLPVVAVLGIALYFKYIRKLPITNQVFALTVVAVLFPPVSHDYTLLHLYTVWGMLALLAIRHRGPAHLRSLLPAFICFAVCMSPETEFILRNQTFGGQFKCIALCILLYLSIRYPLPDVTAPTQEPQPAPDQLATQNS